MSDVKTQHNNILLSVVALIVTVVIVGLIGFFTLDDTEEVIQGEVEVSEFRVSCKLPGRVVELRVQEGDYVHVGDTLAIIGVPEADAQQKVAVATEGAAQALSNIASEGARKETIEGAKKLWQAAEDAAKLAEQTYQRTENLFKEGVVTQQKRDEALAARNATKATAAATKSQYELASNGLREEEKEAARKQVDAAKGAVQVVASLLKETVQIATVEGEVSNIYPKEGELLGLGSPIMTIAINKDMWGVFNVREDQLKGLTEGSVIKAYVPAFDKDIDLKVFHVKDEGSYATWKATKTNGQYDLKTFEVKARPVQSFEGLRPGMSLIVKK